MYKFQLVMAILGFFVFLYICGLHWDAFVLLMMCTFSGISMMFKILNQREERDHEHA